MQERKWAKKNSTWHTSALRRNPSPTVLYCMSFFQQNAWGGDCPVGISAWQWTHPVHISGMEPWLRFEMTKHAHWRVGNSSCISFSSKKRRLDDFLLWKQGQKKRQKYKGKMMIPREHLKLAEMAKKTHSYALPLWAIPTWHENFGCVRKKSHFSTKNIIFHGFLVRKGDKIIRTNLFLHFPYKTVWAVKASGQCKIILGGWNSRIPWLTCKKKINWTVDFLRRGRCKRCQFLFYFQKRKSLEFETFLRKSTG